MRNAWLICAAMTSCALFAVSALAQDADKRTKTGPSVGSLKSLPDLKLKIPAPIEKIVVEIKTGEDDFRAGSSVTYQLFLPDGRSQPAGNLRHWEIRDAGFRHSPSDQAMGIGSGDLKKYFIDLARPMTIAELRTYSLKLTFDGAPRNVPDSDDNWDIDEILIYTPGICSRYQGIELATVGSTPAVGRIFQRMSGGNRLARVPMLVTGDVGNERTTKLEAEFVTGQDDLRGGAIATATVRLVDGTTYPPVSLNGGEAWGGGSRRKVHINLPVPTLVSSIESIEIGFDGQGRNFGEGYDNWDIQRISITSLEACKANLLVHHKGKPWWRASADRSQKIFYFR